MIGGSNPYFLQMTSIFGLSTAFAICVQFQVSKYSILPTLRNLCITMSTLPTLHFKSISYKRKLSIALKIINNGIIFICRYSRVRRFYVPATF